MEIKKDRSQIQCYWETQPGGCSKPHCAFKHMGQAGAEEPAAVPVPQPQPSTLETSVPAPANRKVFTRLGNTTEESMSPASIVKKAANVEETSVPSPKHDPIIINPHEEESDQESPEKQRKILQTAQVPNKPKLISTSKLGNRLIAKKSESGNVDFGVKSLEDIRKEKALQTLRRNKDASHVETKSEDEVNDEDDEEENDVEDHAATDLVKSLTARIAARKIPQKAKTSVKARLGLQEFAVGIKSLSELKKEKQKTVDMACSQEDNKPNAVQVTRRVHLGKKDESNIPVKTRRIALDVSKAVQNKTQTSVQQKSEESGEIKIKSLAEIRREKLLKAKQSASKSEVDHNGAQTSKETPAVKPGLDSGLESQSKEPEIKVKSLAEIKKEKLLREKPKQISGQKDESNQGEIEVKPQRQLKRVRELYKPPARQSIEEPGSTSTRTPGVLRKSEEKTVTTQSVKQDVKPTEIKVKSFEEIMREKQLRKKQLEVAGKSQNDSEGAAPAVKRKRVASPIMFNESKNAASNQINTESDVQKNVQLSPRKIAVQSRTISKNSDIQKQPEAIKLTTPQVITQVKNNLTSLSTPQNGAKLTKATLQRPHTKIDLKLENKEQQLTQNEEAAVTPQGSGKVPRRRSSEKTKVSPVSSTPEPRKRSITDSLLEDDLDTLLEGAEDDQTINTKQLDKDDDSLLLEMEELLA